MVTVARKTVRQRCTTTVTAITGFQCWSEGICLHVSATSSKHCNAPDEHGLLVDLFEVAARAVSMFSLAAKIIRACLFDSIEHECLSPQ